MFSDMFAYGLGLQANSQSENCYRNLPTIVKMLTILCPISNSDDGKHIVPGLYVCVSVSVPQFFCQLHKSCVCSLNLASYL